MSHSKDLSLSIERKLHPGKYTYTTPHPNGFDEIEHTITDKSFLARFVPYGMFLGINKEYLGQQIRKDLGKSNGIINETFEESQRHKLIAGDDGNLYKNTANGIELFNTHTKNKEKRFLLEISNNGEIFVHDIPNSSNQSQPVFSHASFNTNPDGKKQSLFDGMTKAENGKITYIDPESGHFKPKLRHLYNAIVKLNAAGFLDKNVRIGVRSKSENEFSNGRDGKLEFYNLNTFLNKYRDEAQTDWERVFTKRAKYYGLSEHTANQYVMESMQAINDFRLPTQEVESLSSSIYSGNTTSSSRTHSSDESYEGSPAKKRCSQTWQERLGGNSPFGVISTIKKPAADQSIYSPYNFTSYDSDDKENSPRNASSSFFSPDAGRNRSTGSLTTLASATPGKQTSFSSGRINFGSPDSSPSR